MDDLTLGHHLADQSEAVRVRGDQQARSPRWPVMHCVDGAGPWAGPQSEP